MAGLVPEVCRVSSPEAAPQAVASSDHPRQDSPGQPRPWRLRGGLAVLVLLVASTAGVAQWRIQQIGEREAAADEALQSVRTRLPDLLSYRYATLEDDLENALRQTTGDFTDDYAALIDEVVRPTATQRRIVTEAVVNAAGVVSVDSDAEVVVLVFLTQSTTTKNTEEPAVSGSRVEVTMRRTDSEWLIADLQTR
ncbi:hypothetical protein [Nocardioides marinus]|uniref:Mce-associated membrane protein n=1 Tax=Nocardioides marinus TaxID=374514 RepID=A0A7Z0C4R9_9ACTN|nr:hypothetical protein [Nocardioides marinus]NYI11572.1 Mce-associated membrane protein [Nocardioides marinus]